MGVNSKPTCHLDIHHLSSSEEVTLAFDTQGNAESAFLFLTSDGPSVFKSHTQTVVQVDISDGNTLPRCALLEIKSRSNSTVGCVFGCERSLF